MFVNFNILNQLGSPAINSNTFANRPAAGQTGRLFVSTDTFEIYRDNGTTWDLIGGPGSSTITGTGTATQVAYFTSSQAIGSSANLYWDNTAGALGINTATPGAELDVHGTGTIAQFNTTAATGNVFLAIQRSGTGLWRIGDTYNGGNNFFELHNTVLTNNAIQVLASSNEATFLSGKTYTTGNSIGIAVQHNLTIPNGVNVGLAALGGVNSNLNLSLGGSTTVANTGRQGLEGSTTISFSGAGTLTMTQGTTVRAFSALSSVYAFNGSAVGTITHLAGLRICFPDNVGSAVNITNNYALLINDQTTGTGTVTYTNRWGIYQEGASDLNYMAANLLLGSTVNNGNRLQVTGNGNLTGDMTADAYYLNGMIGGNGALYWTSDRVTLANYNANGVLHFEVNGGAFAAMFDASGNLGLGYTSMTSKLQVNGDIDIAAGSQYKAGGVNALASDGSALYLKTGTQLYIQNNSSTNLCTITSTGNVGIGTTSPTQKLSIQTSVGGAWISAGDAVNSANPSLFGSFGDGAAAIYTQAAYPIYFSTNATERMRITSGGNFLIGTTTDAGQKLQVDGNALIGAGGTLSLTSGDIYYVSNAGYGILSANTNRVLSVYNGEIVIGGTIKTAAPSGGTAASWKLGSRVAATVVVNTTEYIEIDIGGTLYKLATVT